MISEQTEKPIAYVDYIEVCGGGQCGQVSGACEPSVRIVGHCDDGGDVAFLVVVRDEAGKVYAHSLDTPMWDGLYRDGLLAQQGNGYLITSQNNLGPPWLSCEFDIMTGGAGGYRLSQYLKRSLYVPLGVGGVRYTVQAFASPVEWVCTEDGQLLRRKCTGEWNWETGEEVVLHMYRQGRIQKCDHASAGLLPMYRKPVMSDIQIAIGDDQDDEGYASVTISLETDVPAQVQAYYALAMEGGVPGDDVESCCDPFSMWRSGVSPEAKQHTLSLPWSTLRYSREVRKEYCLKLVAWPPRYRWVDWARAYSEQLSFTLPSS